MHPCVNQVATWKLSKADRQRIGTTVANNVIPVTKAADWPDHTRLLIDPNNLEQLIELAYQEKELAGRIRDNQLVVIL